MYLPLGTFSPTIKIGFVSASRGSFPRSLSERRAKQLLKECTAIGLNLFVPDGEAQIIETKAHALEAASQMKSAGCDAAVLYLGNFSPEIEDANFVKHFPGISMIIAAAEESKETLKEDRGDALCGLLSTAMAVQKRGLMSKVHIPEDPLVSSKSGVAAIADFTKVIKVIKGISNATIGLFGPRPRDFETCNYNISSIASLGVEVEEDLSDIIKSMTSEVGKDTPKEFIKRLSAYEKAVLNLRDDLRLSGMTTQCWSEQEYTLRHVPCYINARMASQGFPISCENDAYSLVAELMGQYASDASVTTLDLNHSIPENFDVSISDLPTEDLVGLFHCGNTDLNRLKNPKMKHQVIMKRLMEPEGEPDITRGTIEGQIAASPITILQIHGTNDKIQAYIAEGKILDIDPRTFGSTGVAYIPGFKRFYRHVILGNFHHHTAVAFDHVGGVLFDTMKLLGIDQIYTPNPDYIPYPKENIFRRPLRPPTID